MKRIWYYEFPIGTIGIAEDGTDITDLLFPQNGCPADAEEMETPLLQEAARQLKEYFEKKRTVFDLPLNPSGTPFQRSCWQALLTIPYGQTRSYQDIAVQIGNPKAVRAVGMANHNNPISILIPCHRVIGKNGSLTGYGGGLSAKSYLLDLEQSAL